MLNDGAPSSGQLIRNDARTPLGRVTMAGFIKDSPGVQGTPRVLGSYAMVYLLAGSGWYRDVMQRVRRVRAGDLLIIFPELGHTYGPGEGEHWSEFYCVFDGPAFDLLRDTGLLTVERPLVQPASGTAWLNRVQATLFGPTAETLAQRTILVSRFVQLVAEMAATTSTPAEPAAPKWIVEACQMLQQLDSDLQPAAVAERLEIPYETFRKRFQHHVGVSPGRYRLTRRIDAACGLLLETDLTLEAIAERLGFANPFHFSRRFKDITGVAPRDFRQRLPRDTQQG